MNAKPIKLILLAGLFLFAIVWVSGMGLVSAVRGSLTSVSGPGALQYSKDGTVRADITHLERDKFHISMSLNVTDKDGKVLPGLTQQDVEVWDSGERVAQLSKFIPAGQGPVRICLVIDYSNSMKGPKIEGARAAALALLDMMRDNTDSLGLYFFNGTLQKTDTFERLAMGPLTPERRQQARSAITDTPLNLWTPMFSSMDKAIEGLKSVSGRRLLVVLTDGMDTEYRSGKGGKTRIKGDADTKTDEVTKLTNEMGVPIYMVSLAGGRSDEVGMKKIADKGKGKFISAKSPEDVKQIYQSIGEALQNEYTIEYDMPRQVEDGRTRRVEVRFRHGSSGTETRGEYSMPGVVSTGSGRQTTSVGTGTPQDSGVSPFPIVFFPLALIMALAFAVPYLLWLRPKGTAAG